MGMKRIMILAVAASALAGCWTFSTTEYPAAQLLQAPADTNVTVSVTGFDALRAFYRGVFTYDTVYVPGYYGRHYCRPGYVATVPSQHYIADAAPTDAFRVRALDLLERAGYVVGAPTPDWTVNVVFGGPAKDGGDMAAGAAWMIGTLFFCDYEAVSWTAQLRVRDNRTGRLVLSHDYVQRYETKVFGLIPLFGIASCQESSFDYMQSWCLSALTDRAVADVTAFLSGKR